MFTDETAACMLVGEHAFVMLLTREKFAKFSKLPIADPTNATRWRYCFSASSRDEVDAVTDAALAAGATTTVDTQDYGFMYSRSFFDLDGHGWKVMWMDRGAEQGPRRRGGRAGGRRRGLSLASPFGWAVRPRLVAFSDSRAEPHCRRAASASPRRSRNASWSRRRLRGWAVVDVEVVDAGVEAQLAARGADGIQGL